MSSRRLTCTEISRFEGLSERDFRIVVNDSSSAGQEQVTTIIDRRYFCLALGAGLVFAPSACQAAGNVVFRPEDFGAHGDGRTNDTEAFSAMARSVNAAGGGTIILEPRTYIVGQQRSSPEAGAEFAFTPTPLLEFRDCRFPLIVRGNGARLICASNLRFGNYDAVSGRSRQDPMPFYALQYRASPYSGMIVVTGATGSVLIENLELDGNADSLRIGGRWGDQGWQVPAYGIILQNNKGSETIRDVHCHGHATDGLIIDGLAAVPAHGTTRIIERLKATDNGRQGVSVVGGHGYIFRDCEFGRSGRGPVQSPPGAGVDIEPEGGKTIRHLTFERCIFFDNFGCGMVSHSGDSADITFTDCRFVGTTSWSAWPKKPGIVFNGCSFIGALSNPHGDRDAQRATRFYDCIFLDDPALAGGEVYLGEGGAGPIADLYHYENVLFERCRFTLTHAGILPSSTRSIYLDCVMSQKSSHAAYPRGIYRGRNVIDGPVDLLTSRNEGELVLNGRRFGARNF